MMSLRVPLALLPLLVASAVACSKGSDDSCRQSGSFQVQATPYGDQGTDATGASCPCPGPYVNLDVTWASDGTATVNGETCVAVCGNGGTPTTCSSMSLPPAGSTDQNCPVNLFCCGIAGLPSCDAVPIVEQVIFSANDQAPRVQTTFSGGDPACTCMYYENAN